MEIARPFKDLFFFVIPDFYVLDEEAHKKQVQKLVDEYKKSHVCKDDVYNRVKNFLPINGLNFKVEKDVFLENLYDKFQYISTYLTSATIRSKEPAAWCYCTNQFEHPGIAWHDHEITSTINSVYYLNVPPVEEGGGLLLRSNEGLVYQYIPSKYELVLFPNYMSHTPLPPKSSDYRLALNMELLCHEEADTLFQKINSRFEVCNI